MAGYGHDLRVGPVLPGAACRATPRTAAGCRGCAAAGRAAGSVSHSRLGGWERQGRRGGRLGLGRAGWRPRAYGDFWSHMLVAEGAGEVSAEPEVSLWDLAAMMVVVEEAGGTFTDLSARRPPDGGSPVSTTRLLPPPALQPPGA